MGEEKEVLGQKYREAEAIGADKNIPIGEAIGQVFGMIHNEYSAAAEYTASRAQRKKTVAERLRNTRKERGMKQQDVAEKTGINVITLSGYEIGKNEPNMEALVRLADVYDVSLDYLMCRTNEKR